MKEVVIFSIGLIAGVVIMLVTSCVVIEKYLLPSLKDDGNNVEEDCSCDDNCDCKEEKWIVK